MELLIALAIMALLAVVAMPSLVNRMPEYRLRRSAMRVFADLRAARMQAISVNTNVEVTFSPARLQYTIWVDADRDQDRDTGEVRTETLENDHNLALQVNHTTGTFNPRGMFEGPAQNRGLRLQLSSDHAQDKAVVVFPSGDVYATNF